MVLLSFFRSVGFLKGIQNIFFQSSFLFTETTDNFNSIYFNLNIAKLVVAGCANYNHI